MIRGSGAEGIAGHLLFAQGPITQGKGAVASQYRLTKPGSFHVVATLTRDATDAGTSAFTVDLYADRGEARSRVVPTVTVPAAPAGTVTRIVWEHVAYPVVTLFVSVGAGEPDPVVFSLIDLSATPT